MPLEGDPEACNVNVVQFHLAPLAGVATALAMGAVRAARLLERQVFPARTIQIWAMVRHLGRRSPDFGTSCAPGNREG